MCPIIGICIGIVGVVIGFFLRIIATDYDQALVREVEERRRGDRISSTGQQKEDCKNVR